VDGLDGIYVGPTDLSLSVRRGGADDREHMQAVISSIITRAVAAGVPVGAHTGDAEQARRHAGQGATIVTAAVDDVALTDAVRRHLDLVTRYP
jgi:4-hydroxy-2-oxoheptanedioate aldolase